MAKVLVIDDDRTICEMVRRSLEKHEIEVATAGAAELGLQFFRADPPDLVLLDILLPGMTGLDVFQEIRKIDRRIPVVFITSSDDIDTTISAMQLGAYDYLTKPLDLPMLHVLVEKAIDSCRMMSTQVALPIGQSKPVQVERFIGRSPKMMDVFKAIGRVAAENVAVLIRGESGTGKELVARAIYQHSHRAAECFMAINCAALSDTLLESELFGHEKGAFTGADKQRIGKFEQCNGGTIFLDEVGDMTPLTQGKILRLLQEQKFERVGGNTTIETDVRIIAATNRNLERMVEEETFREDLFYRLNGLTISLPPLSDREQDLHLLVEHFLSVACYEMNRTNIEGVSPEALALLTTYPWPGNVRELKSVIRQSLLNCTGPVIVPAFLPESVRSHAGLTAKAARVEASRPETTDSRLPSSDLAAFIDQRLAAQTNTLYAEVTEMMERYLFIRVLTETGGNQSRAAELLGVTRGKIRDRIAQFGISLDQIVSLSDDSK